MQQTYTTHTHTHQPLSMFRILGVFWYCAWEFGGLFFFNLNLFLLFYDGKKKNKTLQHSSIQCTVNVIVKYTKNHYKIYSTNSMMLRIVSGDSCIHSSIILAHKHTAIHAHTYSHIKYTVKPRYVIYCICVCTMNF